MTGFYQDSGEEAVVNPRIDRTLSFDLEYNLGSSPAITNWDLTKKNKLRYTLGANVTLTFTNPQGPSSFIIKVIQDATGGRTIAWPATVKWPAGSPPTLTVAANAVDLIGFYFDGTNYHGTFTLDSR